MPSIIQTAFALEAFLNTPAVAAFMFYPEKVLPSILATSAASTELNGTATLLARFIGGIMLALTPQLLLGLPNDRDAATKRKLAYVTLGTSEAAIIPVLLWEAFRATDAEKVLGSGGLSRTSALVCASNLAPLLAWRVGVWFMRPGWFAGEDQQARKRE